MPDLALVYPHQLFDEHPAIVPGRAVALIEDSLLFGSDPTWPIRLHQQKLTLHRASMRSYADRLTRAGHEIHYLEHNRTRSTRDHLAELAGLGFTSFHLADPVDDVLSRRLARFAADRDLEITQTPTPMFLTPPEFLESQFSSGKKPFMARFYEAQRKRMGILVDDEGKPEGGRWSFDEANRKKLPRGITVPEEPAIAPSPEVGIAREEIAATHSDYHGTGATFAYPVTHQAAADWLDQFLEERFERFGDYEDAISSHHRVMWHSLLTPMLNIGLLTPQQVVDRTLEYAAEHPVPLNSLEGFIRQVIGWREFMAAMYRRHGVEMRNGNFWELEDRPIPVAFYTGETGIPPIDDAIRHALDTGWCHHIERLMLLGNFMLLCGFHPTRVYEWFMELFVDAYDWVMVPNVYGMSQFADGGIFTTKPYVSGSNYIRKMSDYRKGEWCDTWDGLFWSFIKRYEDFFRSQYRLAMMARNLDRMGLEKLQAHQENANRFLDSLS